MVVVACPAKPAKPSVCYLRIPVGPMRVLAGLRTEHATVTKRDATFHPGTTLLAHNLFMSLQRDPFVKTFGDRRELNATTLTLARNVKKIARRWTFRSRGAAAERSAREQDIELTGISRTCDSDALAPNRQNGAFEQINLHRDRVARISGPMIFIPVSHSSLIDYFARCGRVAPTRRS